MSHRILVKEEVFVQTDLKLRTSVCSVVEIFWFRLRWLRLKSLKALKTLNVEGGSAELLDIKTVEVCIIPEIEPSTSDNWMGPAGTASGNFECAFDSVFCDGYAGAVAGLGLFIGFPDQGRAALRPLLYQSGVGGVTISVATQETGPAIGLNGGRDYNYGSGC